MSIIRTDARVKKYRGAGEGTVMVKGCQKKTIHIKDTGSKYYEEAYFVLRPGVSESKVTDSDMISEAVRIAGESLSAPYPYRRKGQPVGVIPFLGGLFAGGAVSAALTLIFLL